MIARLDRLARVSVLCAALLPALPAAAGSTRVQVEFSGGGIIAAFSVQTGDRWCVSWNHSVAGFPVRDCYVFRGGQMILDRSHQPDFAAGLGHIPGRGDQRSDERGGYWIERINEPVRDGYYVLRVGTLLVDHRIHHERGEIPLSELAAGQPVVIRLVTEQD